MKTRTKISNKVTSREKLIDKHAGYCNEIQSKLDLIKAGMVDRLNETESVDIHWGHIGTLAHVNKQLEEIVEFLGL